MYIYHTDIPVYVCKTNLLYRAGEYRLHPSDSPIDPDLLAFVRVFTANKELLTLLNSLSKAEVNQKLRVQDIQGEDDNKALEFLQKRCVVH